MRNIYVRKIYAKYLYAENICEISIRNIYMQNLHAKYLHTKCIYVKLVCEMYVREICIREIYIYIYVNFRHVCEAREMGSRVCMWQYVKINNSLVSATDDPQLQQSRNEFSDSWGSDRERTTKPNDDKTTKTEEKEKLSRQRHSTMQNSELSCKFSNKINHIIPASHAVKYPIIKML